MSQESGVGSRESGVGSRESGVGSRELQESPNGSADFRLAHSCNFLRLAVDLARGSLFCRRQVALHSATPDSRLLLERKTTGGSFGLMLW